MANLQVEICGVSFKNPVIAASGTFAFGKEMGEYYDLSLLGGISSKGITLEKRLGNPAPRIAETASGVLNSVGLQNPGVDAFLKEELPYMQSQDTVTIVNVSGGSIAEYAEQAKRLCGRGISMIELNISCPNFKGGGMVFGTDPGMAKETVEAVKAYCDCPLMVKLSPNVTSIKTIAKAVVAGGADVLSLINTITAMAVDAYTRKPVLQNITGGLSGPAIKPVALRMVYEVAQEVEVPIVGLGGIMTGVDAAEFLLCGATAVMVGTANLTDPMAGPRIVQELHAYLEQTGVSDVNEIIGKLVV